ncbi:MAG: hypothetical protein Q9174_003917 [Haloplaca sp. 1 TL-2023]
MSKPGTHTAESHPMVIGYLGPNTENAFSVAYMQSLLAEKDTGLPSHAKTIIEHQQNANDEGCGLSTDSEAEGSSKPAPKPASVQSYGQLMLNLDHVHGCYPLGWSIGRGYSQPVFASNRGIDICLNAQQAMTRSISHAHALFYFHEQSGVLSIMGLSRINPPIYWVDGEPIRLFESQSHVITSKINHFRFGDLELVLRIPSFDEEGYEALRNIRDRTFQRAKFERPHPRLFAIPQAKPFSRLDQILLHSSIAGGGFGWVRAGVDMKTGEPLAVKEVRVDPRHKLQSIESEIEVSLKFPDTRGLMQASDVQCEHDCHVNSTTLRQHGRAALAFCRHKTTAVYLVFPLATTDFHHHDWRNEKLWFIVTALDDVLEGVLALHLADWMHLDLTPKNLLLMSTKTGVAKVADFGKAVHAQTAKNTYLCPPAYSAPEVDGNPYTNKVDCFNMGLVFCHIILAEEFAEILSLRSDEDDDMRFYYQLDLALEKYGEKGPVQESLANIATGLTAYYPDKRWSIRQALAELPRWDGPKQLFKWRSGQTFTLPNVTARPMVPNVDGRDGRDTRPKKRRARKSKVAKEARETANNAEQKDEAGYEASDELKHKRPGNVAI